MVVLATYLGVARLEGTATLTLDRYAAVDPSFRLIRDARTARSAETAEYYAFLRANTLVAPGRVHPPEVDLVVPLRPAPARMPHIFLLVVDSLRRDYLSPYNPLVTFTPEIAKLAADSFVFEHAFTRYAGTALAVTSLWAGGMVPHMVKQPEFSGRNALLKLLAANHYVRMMDMDNIVSELMPPGTGGGDVVVLDRGRTSMEFEVCRTLEEVQGNVTGALAAPVFFYALPQNVHIAVASRRKVPDGEAYPGFFGPVASTVRRVDACLGAFVRFLKRADLYDDSVIVVTSDHGDSLGEAGRWGHAYFLVPEVMRIPLIVHLPAWLKSRVTADVTAASFTTDIAPTLYTLFGYRPRDLGPLFGQPLFTPAEAPTARRQEPFLLASSYGAVYAMLRRNGRGMYVVDAVDGHDYAFDLRRSPAGDAIETTAGMTAENRHLIRDQIEALAAFYRISGTVAKLRLKPPSSGSVGKGEPSLLVR